MSVTLLLLRISPYDFYSFGMASYVSLVCDMNATSFTSAIVRIFFAEGLVMHTLFPFSVEARSLYRGVSLFGVVPSQIAGLPHLRTGSRVARELVQLRGMASAGTFQSDQVVQPQSVSIRPTLERPQRVLHRVDEGQLLASMKEIARRGYSAERFTHIYHYRQLAPEFIRGKYGSKSNTEFRDAYNACHYALMKAVDHEFSPLLVSGGSVMENPGLAFAQLE